MSVIYKSISIIFQLYFIFFIFIQFLFLFFFLFLLFSFPTLFYHHYFIGTLWLHSNSYLKNSGIFAVRARYCLVVGGKVRRTFMEFISILFVKFTFNLFFLNIFLTLFFHIFSDLILIILIYNFTTNFYFITIIHLVYLFSFLFLILLNNFSIPFSLLSVSGSVLSLASIPSQARHPLLQVLIHISFILLFFYYLQPALLQVSTGRMKYVCRMKAIG